MEDEKLKDFYTYLRKRKNAFEFKYKLTDVQTDYSELRIYHYPNSLKYLDIMSQWFIRNLNQPVSTTRDKILTVFVFRVVGDKRLCRRYANSKGVFTLQLVNKLAKKLNRMAEPLGTKYSITINRRGNTGYRKGDSLRIMVEDFLSKLPDDMFVGWKTSEIYSYLNDKDIVYLSDFLCHQLCSDLSFINELEIEIDVIPYLPQNLKEVYLEITGRESFKRKEYITFVYDTMEAYRKLRFISIKEKMVLPYDIINMLAGYKYYKNTGATFFGVGRYRNYPRIRSSKLDDILVSRSMYDYYKNFGLHNKAD